MSVIKKTSFLDLLYNFKKECFLKYPLTGRERVRRNTHGPGTK